MWLRLPLKGCWAEQPDGCRGKRPFEENFVCFAKFMDSKRGIVKALGEVVVGLTKNSFERPRWESTLETKRNRCFIFPGSQHWEFPAGVERLFNGDMLCLKYELWEFHFAVASHLEMCSYLSYTNDVGIQGSHNPLCTGWEGAPLITVEPASE